MIKRFKITALFVAIVLFIGVVPSDVILADDYSYDDGYDYDFGYDDDEPMDDISGKTGLFDDGYGNTVYFIDGIMQRTSGLVTIDGKKYLLSYGMLNTHISGPYTPSGESKKYIFDKGVVVDKTGIYTYKWASNYSEKYYIKNGVVQSSANGIKTINAKKYYLKDGVVDKAVANIVKSGSKYYVIENGVVKRQVGSTALKMIKQQKKYPEGKRWTNANMYKWSQGVYGYGCAGFAFYLNDIAYGKTKKVVTHKKWTSVKSGDIIRLDYDGHSVVALEKTSKGVIVAEGNYNSSIHWFRYIPFTEIKKTGTYIQTRK